MVVCYHLGARSLAFPIIGALACFGVRLAGLRFGIGLPLTADVKVDAMPRPGRRRDRNG